MHNRAPRYTKRRVTEVRTDPSFVYNPHLIDTYVALGKGKIKVALTRLPSNAIHSGFFVRKEDGSIEHISNLAKEASPPLKAVIRAGIRPVIDVEWSPHAPAGGGYVCADDENILAAYRELAITMLPCRVLRPISRAGPEAAIWLEEKRDATALAKSVPPEITGYRSYLGNKQFDLKQGLKHLIELCEDTASSVRLFHQKSTHDIHYHEMLHAVVRRHARALESILNLSVTGRQEHAIAICRMSYEAFLNFYLDWLAPQFIGPRLQLLAALKSSETPANLARDPAWKTLANFPSLFEKTSEKARLSPLGVMFHQVVYPSWSLVAHQSYRQLEFEASTFDDIGQDNSFVDDAQLIRSLDFLTAALLTRVRNDVGLI